MNLENRIIVPIAEQKNDLYKHTLLSSNLLGGLRILKSF